MTNVAIVSTSIHERPAAYVEWAKQGDLFIALDMNSPIKLRDYASEIGAIYLTPEMQERTLPWSSDIGWHCVQRRNAAIYEALIRGYDYVVTVDDDNWPTARFVEHHLLNMGVQSVSSTVDARTGFLNTGDLCIPRFHQRGVPYGINTEPLIRRESRSLNVVVSQAQIVGDPDCDAVERICHSPEVQAVAQNAVITPGIYAAFNSQATMWTREWAPVMAVLPHIGRYDDIFASFLFHRLAREYGTALYVGTPIAKQDRNHHNLQRDLRAENWGMRNVLEFCASLDRAHISADMPLTMAYDELIVAARDILPGATQRFAHAWVKTWTEIL